jgi:signal transduction histidine kinase/CheY-like chemotaxis protein
MKGGGHERRAAGLATRLQRVLALVAFTVVVVAGLCYLRLLRFEHRIIALYEDRVVPLRELKAVSDRHAIDVVDAVHKVSARRFTPAHGRDVLDAALEDIDAAWVAYAATRTADDDLRLLAETAPLLATARGAVVTARDLMARGDLAALEAFRTGAMYSEIDPLTARLGQLVDVQLRETDALVRDAQRDLRAARQGATIALVLAGAVAMGIGVLFARRLETSLGAIEPVVRAAAGGDLSRRVGLAGTDELARMAADIDRMITNLEESRRVVEAHATAIEASEREARAANAAKSIFLSSMSHELRTPLNVILGYTQLLLRTPARSDEDAVELGRIMKAGNHLLGLIDDVLSISKIEAGTLVLRSRAFAPAELLRNVEDIVAPAARAKGLALEITLAPSVPPQVECDDRKLGQILVNLLGNAVKFTARGHVRARVEHAADRLLVAVADTGPGMSAEELERLFHAFGQGAAGAAAAEGAGLGLYISQSLARLLGGEIRVRSTLGEGSEFSFSVDAPSAVGPSVAPRGYRNARLPPGVSVAPMLVVDDRDSNRDVLARLLRGLGVEVVEASTGEEALALCAGSAFSIVWMDLRMPGIGGIEALSRVRAREAERGLRRSKIVAITASAIEFDRATALEAGFDDLVTKPFLDETVCRVVEGALGIPLDADAPPPRPPPAATADLASRVPGGLRARLVQQLVRGELDEALRTAGEVPDAATRSGLRAVIESFDVDALITALRAPRSEAP